MFAILNCNISSYLLLLKFVLYSLLIYFLFFFKAFTGIISSIKSLFKYLFIINFEGGGEEVRKIVGLNVIQYV